MESSLVTICTNLKLLTYTSGKKIFITDFNINFFITAD